MNKNQPQISQIYTDILCALCAFFVVSVSAFLS